MDDDIGRMLEKMGSQLVEECEKKGITPEQEACAMKAQTFEENLALRDVAARQELAHRRFRRATSRSTSAWRRNRDIVMRLP